MKKINHIALTTLTLFLIGSLISCDYEELSGTCEGDGTYDTPTVSFEADIKPIIENAQDNDGNGKCVGCHGDDGTPSGGFIFGDSTKTFTQWSYLREANNDERCVIVPGKPTESLIYTKISGTQSSGAQMPKGKPVWRDENRQLLFDWIKQGARNN